jgi:hypothetical protein
LISVNVVTSSAEICQGTKASMGKLSCFPDLRGHDYTHHGDMVLVSAWTASGGDHNCKLIRRSKQSVINIPTLDWLFRLGML